MTETPMSSMQRVRAALSFQEPDRVPFFLLLTMHGARELGLGIEEYFSRAENLIEGQLRMQEKYRHDCLYPFFYASIEVEAFGAEVLFVDDGPPNAAEPFLREPEQIEGLTPPKIEDAASLRKVLRAIEGLKERVGDRVPIIGVVMSPFSLPIMQLGFESYFEVMFERPELFERLMRVNEEFCVAWANAQLSAGASTICYFDPVCSPTITPPETARQTGFPIAQRSISRIKGSTGTHLASGLTLPVIDDLVETGTCIVGVGAQEDLGAVKASCDGRLAVLGNLNGIEMRRWSAEEAASSVRTAIARAGRGGGFILSDQHGEIPWQVPEEVLSTISETVQRDGRYPLAEGLCDA